jgi:hypothetical protein
MKSVFPLLIFFLASTLTKGQCSDLSISVSSSDTALIQLYHAGFFLIPSGFDNVCEWEVTTFSGDVVFQDTTQGDAFEQGLVLFEHTVPITDSMKVTVFIKNSIEGITCTLSDTLFWEETEVLPGLFIGNWAILNENGGVEGVLTSFDELTIGHTLDHSEIALFPTLVNDHIQVEGPLESFSLNIVNLRGQVVAVQPNIQGRALIDVSQLIPGTYFVHFRNQANAGLGVKVMVKR